MNYKIAPLILTPGQRSNSVSEVFISQPEANKESIAGKLFALIEIESKKADDLKIINFLINTLNYDYYQNEKMILRERLSNLKIEHIFESALAKTNKKFFEFLQNEKIKIDQSIINITAGVIYKESVHFANSGKNKALLIYKTKSEKDQQKYKLIDITDQANPRESHKHTNINKLFSNVISGSIPTSGFFIFTTETLPEYLSTKQIIDIITTLPPASAVEQLKNILVKINAYVPFLSIIIKNTITSDLYEQDKIKSSLKSNQPISGLNTTEETTEKLLTPSGLIGFKKWGMAINRFFNFIKLKSFQANNKKVFLLKDKIFSKKKTYLSLIKKIFEFIKLFFTYLAGIAIYFYKIFSNRKKLYELPTNLKIKPTYYLSFIKYYLVRLNLWFKELSKRNKILFIVLFISLIIFSQNLLWQNYKNKKVQKEKNYNDLILAIDQKQNQIDASLLYGNEDNAKKLLDEVKQLLAQIPSDIDETEGKYEEFLLKNQVHIEKISHIIKIINPIELANFSNLDKQANPTNLIMLKDKIYAGDLKNKLIYSLDINNNLITALPKISTTTQEINYDRLEFPVTEKGNLIYYLDLNKIIELNTDTDEINKINIDYSGNLMQITDMANFNNRLYLLDPKNNQIYRFSKSQNKFTRSFAWLTDKSDLTDSVSLDIDGSVYVLKTSGQIIKFLKGKKEDFTLATIEPIFSQATKLYVSPEHEFIYILEPINKRLVVFNKDGKFLNQYTGDQFTNLKDFLVDESAKKIYFLDNNSVYSIEAQHYNK